MIIDETHQELRDCWSDWAGFLANKNFIERNGLICWPNYQPTMFERVSWEDIEALATNRQYSFQLHDGSVIQVLYDFKSRDRLVRSATLAYFQAPPHESLEFEDEDGAEHQSDFEAASLDRGAMSPRWIRMDYVVLESSSCVHADCHLHLSGFPDTRIIVNGVPGPRQFIETIFAWFYPDLYSNVRLTDNEEDRLVRFISVNRLCLPLQPATGFHPIFYLSLPPSVRFDKLQGQKTQ